MGMELRGITWVRHSQTKKIYCRKNRKLHKIKRRTHRKYKTIWWFLFKQGNRRFGEWTKRKKIYEKWNQWVFENSKYQWVFFRIFRWRNPGCNYLELKQIWEIKREFIIWKNFRYISRKKYVRIYSEK